MTLKKISLSLLLLTMITALASAQLARVGPVDPANGYPAWYQDKTGLTLEFCGPVNDLELAGGWCLLLTGDTVAPETFPTAFFDEHFYFAADAGDRKVPIPGSASTTVILLRMALEGAFGNGPPLAGDQMVFARLRIKISPVPFDGTYTVYTPYGKFVFADQLASDPRGIFFTEDVGLAPLAFADALNGRIGPFLLPSATPGGAEMPPLTATNQAPDPDPAHFGGVLPPATAYPNTGKSYIADPARLGPITGSPLPPYVVGDGTTRNPNLFRVEGPNGFVYETTDFALQGRVYEGPIAGNLKVDRASYARAATGNNVDVYATAVPGTKGRLPAGTDPATLVSTTLKYYSAPCTATLDAKGNPGPPYSAPPGVAAVQMLGSGTSYFGQNQPGLIPLEVCVEENAVTAGGQTTTTFLPAPLGDQVYITEALYNPASQKLSVKATSSDQMTAQTLTVEGLGTIDPATGQLVAGPLLAPPERVTVRSSARGINQMQMSANSPLNPGNPGGDPALPVAVNDSATTLEDTPVSIGVLANDIAGASAVVSVVSAPLLGSAVVNADGSISYTPNLNANGSDSFTYKLTAGTLVSNEASVVVTITPVNDPPVAVNDSGSGTVGQVNTINVLANDTDPDGAADLANAVIVSADPRLGPLTVTNGVVSYTPTASGSAMLFTYQAVDAAGAISANTATATVNVFPVESIVISKAIFKNGKQGGVASTRWVVAGSDSVPQGQRLTIAYNNGTLLNGTSAAGTVIGTAIVDALGNWTLDFLGASGVLNPTDSTVWLTKPTEVIVTSPLGGSAVKAITLK